MKPDFQSWCSPSNQSTKSDFPPARNLPLFQLKMTSYYYPFSRIPILLNSDSNMDTLIQREPWPGVLPPPSCNETLQPPAFLFVPSLLWFPGALSQNHASGSRARVWKRPGNKIKLSSLSPLEFRITQPGSIQLAISRVFKFLSNPISGPKWRHLLKNEENFILCLLPKKCLIFDLCTKRFPLH